MDWEHRSSLKTIKIVKAHDRNCRWTITDANVSKDNEWLIYASITPRVHLVSFCVLSSGGGRAFGEFEADITGLE